MTGIALTDSQASKRLTTLYVIVGQVLAVLCKSDQNIKMDVIRNLQDLSRTAEYFGLLDFCEIDRFVSSLVEAVDVIPEP